MCDVYERFDFEHVVAAVWGFEVDDCGCLVGDRVFDFFRGASVFGADFDEACAGRKVEMVVSEAVISLDDKFVWDVISNREAGIYALDRPSPLPPRFGLSDLPMRLRLSLRRERR